MITAQRSEGNEHVSQISKGRGFRAEGPLSMEALKWMCTVCGKRAKKPGWMDRWPG